VVKEGFGPLSDPRADRFIEPPGSGKWVAGEGILHKRMTTARQKYSAIPYHHATLAYGRVMRLYLEYALFGDLDKYGAHFRNGLIDEGFVWNVLHSLVSNLKTMHEGNGTRDWEPFVHRDIKGANVLVVNARDKQSKKLNVPTPVLNDYGLARRLPDHSPMDVAECVVWDKIGTPGYCAPESM
jgi:serine/threonine protein kinase